MEHVTLWLKFAAAASIVVIAGLRLTTTAEKLAQAMGWGHAFAGFVILGWATSLPELTISVSAVTGVGSASMAAGNITGSCIFNLGILALLDLAVRRRRVRDGSHIPGLMPLAGFNLVMLAALTGLAWRPDMIGGGGAWTGGGLLIGLYLAATLHGWIRDRAEPKTDDDQHADEPATSLPERRALIVRCLAIGAVILGTGIWLTGLGNEMAARYGLDEGFVGTLFLATTSSLPELVTGFAAIRLGLHIMAAGSILGSNIFNLGILGICDLLYVAGPGAGTHIAQAAAAAEPGRMLHNTVIALSMTVLAWAAKRRQMHSPDYVPGIWLPVAALVLYVVGVGRP